MDPRFKLLTRLAGCAPRSLAEPHAPNLRELHDGAVAAGLTARLPQAAPAKARLHALFDVALEHGLVAVITHFVQEVCAMPRSRVPNYHTLLFECRHQSAPGVQPAATCSNPMIMISRRAAR
jgi:hypothetical protein